MTITAVTVGIGVGLVFAGLLGGYVIAEQTYSPRNLMMNDPQTTTPWMSSMMETMMNDPGLRQQMINQMTENQQFMQDMMNSMMSNSMMSNMQFGTNAPMIMPMIDGYYNGEKVFFVHTEVSDNDMAQMMSTMINFPTLHVYDLKNIPQNELSKVYVFTNGISGSRPYGGGPFMFQIDVFDSIPAQTGYSQFRVPYLVTWNDDSTPRILTSVDEIVEAETTGELTIQKTDNVVNAPMIVWKSNGIEQKASMIQRMFENMPGVDGEVINVDVENYLAIFKLHSPNNIDMMHDQMMGK